MLSFAALSMSSVNDTCTSTENVRRWWRSASTMHCSRLLFFIKWIKCKKKPLSLTLDLNWNEYAAVNSGRMYLYGFVWFSSLVPSHLCLKKSKKKNWIVFWSNFYRWLPIGACSSMYEKNLRNAYKTCIVMYSHTEHFLRNWETLIYKYPNCMTIPKTKWDSQFTIEIYTSFWLFALDSQNIDAFQHWLFSIRFLISSLFSRNKILHVPNTQVPSATSFRHIRTPYNIISYWIYDCMMCALCILSILENCVRFFSSFLVIQVLKFAYDSSIRRLTHSSRFSSDAISKARTYHSQLSYIYVYIHILSLTFSKNRTLVKYDAYLGL